MPKQVFLKISVLGILILSLFSLLRVIKQAQDYFSEASGRPANIMVDTAKDQGPIAPIWQALAQGGEEKYPFDNIVPQITALTPQYIRLDHIYDFYEVVQKENGQLTFNWRGLDKIVNQILATGAKPFFSLSYMPPAIAQGGDIIAPPGDWNDWSTVVQATIEHYSGKAGFNLTDVAYEVWNEPDLFGSWRIGGGKDYRTLYHYAVLGANRAIGVNRFKIGGPAVTAPYHNWVDNFLEYVIRHSLRLDFYSWHRYSFDPEKFLDDVNLVDSWLFQNSGSTVEKYITEWSSSSENSPVHDTSYDAAHLVATIRKLIQRVELAFTFEIKDGPDVTSGQKYWGRWGILTYEMGGQAEKKPKYFALKLLNKMAGGRLEMQGEGTWVTGFAAKQDDKTRIILVNFDPNGRHFENVPLSIVNLENGPYLYEETFSTGAGRRSTETILYGVLEKQIPLSANNIVVVELTKI